MKCSWCQKPVRWWQVQEPLGGGLTDSYGQREHTECQLARVRMIAEHQIRMTKLITTRKWAEKEA